MPVICMDSNVNPDRPKLWQAARRLAANLEVHFRVSSEIIVLPREQGVSDWGLDDYYVDQGNDATLALLNQDGEPMVSAMTDHLNIMAQEVVYVREDARFVEIDTGLIMTRGDFENATYAPRVIWNEDGKPVSVAKAYTKWDGRAEVQRMVYRPGSERMQGNDFYNTWRGMGVEP